MEIPAVTSAMFKVCGSCRRAWPTWESFVTDPEVRLLGLQSRASLPDATVLVFEHWLRQLRLHPHPAAPPPGPHHPRATWPSLRDSEECPGALLGLQRPRPLRRAVPPCPGPGDPGRRRRAAGDAEVRAPSVARGAPAGAVSGLSGADASRRRVRMSDPAIRCRALHEALQGRPRRGRPRPGRARRGVLRPPRPQRRRARPPPWR
ncbi:MAG: hypothetical protein MZV70_08155 [Desulfobacterales bacterium]|nr:hypothetical protein [Desulfobacterales bacterium]